MIRRGDIFWVDFNEIFKNIKNTHPQLGYRPAVVISNNTNNYHNTIVQVVPLTTRGTDLPQHRYIYVHGVKNTILPEHIISIDKKLLEHFYFRLNLKQFAQVEKAIQIQLGFYNNS